MNVPYSFVQICRFLLSRSAIDRCWPCTPDQQHFTIQSWTTTVEVNFEPHLSMVTHKADTALTDDSFVRQSAFVVRHHISNSVVFRRHTGGACKSKARSSNFSVDLAQLKSQTPRLRYMLAAAACSSVRVFGCTRVPDLAAWQTEKQRYAVEVMIRTITRNLSAILVISMDVTSVSFQAFYSKRSTPSVSLSLSLCYSRVSLTHNIPGVEAPDNTHRHFNSCTHASTHTHTHARTHAHTHTCFHAWLFRGHLVELTGECLECSFRLTRGGPYLRGVIGSMVGAYPRGTGSNPVEANGHFFPSYRQLYLSSFSDTLLSTQRRSLQMLDVAVPQIGVGVFSCMIVSWWSWRVSV